jgi:chromosome segregation ATPase
MIPFNPINTLRRTKMVRTVCKKIKPRKRKPLTPAQKAELTRRIGRWQIKKTEVNENIRQKEKQISGLMTTLQLQKDILQNRKYSHEHFQGTTRKPQQGVREQIRTLERDINTLKTQKQNMEKQLKRITTLIETYSRLNS